MKKSAKCEGKIGNNEKDEEIGDWITISIPDDLFKHNIDVDFQKQNYLPLLFNDDTNCKEQPSKRVGKFASHNQLA